MITPNLQSIKWWRNLSEHSKESLFITFKRSTFGLNSPANKTSELSGREIETIYFNQK